MLPLMDDPRWGPYFRQRDAEARGDQIADRNLARNYHVGLGTPDPVQRTLVFFPSPEPPPDPPPVAPPPVGRPPKRANSLMDLAKRAFPERPVRRAWFGGHVGVPDV
jgi:hypothetical protein